MKLNLKAIRRALALAAMLGLALHAAPARAEYSFAVHIDGKLDDAAWRKGRALSAFRTFDGQTPQAATVGRILTDERYLYLAFRCVEPQMEKLEATPLERDGKLWTNDCIELFFAPFFAQEEYYHLIIDANGQIYDAFKRDGVEDVRYETAAVARTQKQTAGWTLEVAIPLCDVGLTRARDALMNFGRERKPVTENTAWHGVFGQPATWKRVPLSLGERFGVDVRGWNFGSPAPQYGRNEATLELAAGPSAPLPVLLAAQENGRWNPKARRAIPSTPSQRAPRVTLPYNLLPQQKPQRLRLAVENGGQTVFRVTYRLNLPASALVATLSAPYYYAGDKYGFVRLESFLSTAGLQAGRIRLSVQAPGGRTVAVRELRPLRRSQRAGFAISAWHNGSGTLTAELFSGDQLLARRQLPVIKRAGPFDGSTPLSCGCFKFASRCYNKGGTGAGPPGNRRKIRRTI